MSTKDARRLLILSTIGTCVGFITLEAIAMATSINTITVVFIGLLAYFGTLGLGYYIGYTTKEQEPARFISIVDNKCNKGG